MEEIFAAIRRSAFRIQEAIAFDDTGYADNQNASGDAQLKVDIKSDLIIEEEMAKVAAVKAISSEEREHEELLNEHGTYLVAYDPLDGSSLIDVNLSVGSIFGIYKESFSGPTIVAAAYVVYGPRIELVIAHERVELYRLNKRNEFVFIQDITLHEKGKLNASGGTQQHWPRHHKEMIDGLFAEGYRLRYSGGMVPDLHQILIKGGGLFSYPGTTDKPEGKLRQIYEVLPFAFIYEIAGGVAVDGTKRLLDLIPRHHHDTTPCFFGSRYEIDRVKEVYGRA